MDLHGAAKNHDNDELNKFSNEKFGKNSYEQMVSALDNWLGKIISTIDFSNTLFELLYDHMCYIHKELLHVLRLYVV